MNIVQVQVKIADLAVLKGQGLLVTYGLGSCVGIALYDPGRKVAGLAHILLNDSALFTNSKSNGLNPAKFADTALPLLMRKMIDQGAYKHAIIAKIAGGASLFNFQSAGQGVGEKNIIAVKSKLEEMDIPLHGAEVGGSRGRTMKLMVDTGAIVITTAGKEEINL